MAEQAVAYQEHGPRALQVPLNKKPKLFDHLLQAAGELPVRLDKRDNDLLLLLLPMMMMLLLMMMMISMVAAAIIAATTYPLALEGDIGG